MTLEELIKAIDDDCDCHGWADDLKALPTPAAGPWIPVWERLPERNGSEPWHDVSARVLATNGSEFRSAVYNFHSSQWNEDGVDDRDDDMSVTHWAELRGPK